MECTKAKSTMLQLRIENTFPSAGFGRRQRALNRWIDTLLKQIAFDVRNTARDLCPKDTWRLHNSLVVRRNPRNQGGGWRVVTEVPYAIYQELGFFHYITGQWIQNPFLIPAAEIHAAQLARTRREIRQQLRAA